MKKGRLVSLQQINIVHRSGVEVTQSQTAGPGEAGPGRGSLKSSHVLPMYPCPSYVSTSFLCIYVLPMHPCPFYVSLSFLCIPLQALAAATGDRSWPVQQILPSSSPIWGSATSLFLCPNFHFGNSDLFTDLVKSDQDELEFPVEQTILILCNSYSCDMNQSYLH